MIIAIMYFIILDAEERKKLKKATIQNALLELAGWIGIAVSISYLLSK
jgi:hypothetical protein